MDEINEELRIKASPTKEFFLYMLTKDILIESAIAELVDNSVDGARAIQEKSESMFKDKTIRIDLNKNQFRIEDNCGGIPVEIARKYAFRFGRPSAIEKQGRTIGHFGVGMKRALFKMGNYFKIESRTIDSYFVVEEDINEWLAKDEEDWDFKFKEVQENYPLKEGEETGTTITVSRLHETVSEKFALENFEKKVKMTLQTDHQISLQNGLVMTLNGIPLTFEPTGLLSSLDLQPAHLSTTFNIDESILNVSIYAGLSKSEPEKAGWYVYCNGRLILEADKTEVTGWKDGIPRFHNQFARFRGYILFDADDPKVLPWNTTKTGLDVSSKSFIVARQEMLNLMRPIIDFLNKLESEKKNKEDDSPTQLEIILDQATTVEVDKIKTEQVFIAPQPKPEPKIIKIEMGKIRYEKPKEELEIVKKKLKAKTYTEIGEKTFDYFFKMECED
ncbi:ATP-binding protein [Paenibacillus humicus]|uniref:ATP-binding protein n=1 Tax=Paenibacillus humicus TaxID=412861 RepID=UPI000FDBC19D|nr:ATP-binding protein [Paenibacillus humicus]